MRFRLKFTTLHIILAVMITFSFPYKKAWAAQDSYSQQRTIVIQDALSSISNRYKQDIDERLNPLKQSIITDSQSYLNSRINSARMSINLYFIYQYAIAVSDFNDYCTSLRTQTEYSLKNEKKSIRDQIMSEVDNIIYAKQQQLQIDLLNILVW